MTSEKGQLEQNPHYTPKQAREAAKREYNRRNAARGRIRRKYELMEMQDKYSAMQTELEKLRQENAALKAEFMEIKTVKSTVVSN